MAENTPMLGQEVKPYGPGNPHPNYGKDPNIMNEVWAYSLSEVGSG